MTLPAWHVLAEALDELAGRGRRTPCQASPGAFVSEEPEERRQAEGACLTCPVLAPCLLYADAAAEPAGVWGGVDRTHGRSGSRATRARVMVHLQSGQRS